MPVEEDGRQLLTGAGSFHRGSWEAGKRCPSAGKYQLFYSFFPVNIIFYIDFRLSKNLNMVRWNLGTRGEWMPFSHSRV